MLDNKYALLFIRGEWPVMDLKYDIMKHPAIDMTAKLPRVYTERPEMPEQLLSE